MSVKEPPSVEPDDWFGLLDDAPSPAPEPPRPAPPAAPRPSTEAKKTPTGEGGEQSEAWEWDPSPAPARRPSSFSQTLSFSIDDVQALSAELQKPAAEVMSETSDGDPGLAGPLDPLGDLGEGEVDANVFIDFGWTPTPVPPPPSGDDDFGEEEPTARVAAPPPLPEPPAPPAPPPIPRASTPVGGPIAASIARGSRPPMNPTSPGIPSVMAARRSAPATMMFGPDPARRATPPVPVPAYSAPRPSTPIDSGRDTIPPMSEPAPSEPPRVASAAPVPPPTTPLSVMRAPTPIVNPIISAEARGAPQSPRPIAPTFRGSDAKKTPVARPFAPTPRPSEEPPEEPSGRPLFRAPPRLPPRAPGASAIPLPASPTATTRFGALPPLPPPPSQKPAVPPPFSPRPLPPLEPSERPAATSEVPDARSFEALSMGEDPLSDEVTPVVFPRREDLAQAARRRQHKVTPAVATEIPQDAIPTPLAPPTEHEHGGDVSARREMRERFELHDFNGALGLAQRLVELDPHDGEALRVAEQCRQRLRAIYIGRLGELTQVPTLTLSRNELRWLTLDHRAGFVLSLIDGGSSIEDIIDVSTMPTFEVLRTLYVLLSQNVISLRGGRR